MRYTLEIQKLLFQVEDNKSLTPKDKIRLLKQAATIADENDDIEWAYEIRLQLIRECYYVASSSELVTEFSWVLNAYEAHPDWFEENDFLWQYKWILGEMYNNPQVSMEQIEAIMEDFKTRLQRNGYGLRPYYDRLYDETLILGNFEKAKEYLDLRNEAPDDAMGSCPACTLDNELDYYLMTGNFDEAYNRAHPLLTKQLACTHVPARTFCALAYYADKAGQQQRAAELLDRAETEMDRLINDIKDENLIVPAGMMVCYLLGTDPAKAWHYFEKTLSWFIEGDAYSRFEFACLMMEGLAKIDRSASVTLSLPTEFELYKPDHVYPLNALYDYFSKEAAAQATAFDKRNGCTAFTDRIAKL